MGSVPQTASPTTNMKSMIFVTLLAFVAARPDTPRYSDSREVVAIIRDDRVNPSAAGEYSFDVETADGIVRSESGYGSGPDGAVESQGSVSFTHPNGESFDLKFVADAAGYKPESSALPVAPTFPHEIPQFVLDQISFAAHQNSILPFNMTTKNEPTSLYHSLLNDV